MQRSSEKHSVYQKNPFGISEGMVCRPEKPWNCACEFSLATGDGIWMIVHPLLRLPGNYLDRAIVPEVDLIPVRKAVDGLQGCGNG